MLNILPMGAWCEFRVWNMFYLNHCSAVCNNVEIDHVISVCLVYLFWLRFHWSLFCRIQWFSKNCRVTIQATNEGNLAYLSPLWWHFMGHGSGWQSMFISACHPGSRFWNYCPGALSFKSSGCGLFEGHPIFQQATVTTQALVISCQDRPYLLFV